MGQSGVEAGQQFGLHRAAWTPLDMPIWYSHIPGSE